MHLLESLPTWTSTLQISRLQWLRVYWVLIMKSFDTLPAFIHRELKEGETKISSSHHRLKGMSCLFNGLNYNVKLPTCKIILKNNEVHTIPESPCLIMPSHKLSVDKRGQNVETCPSEGGWALLWRYINQPPDWPRERLSVTSRELVRIFLEQLWFEFVPVFHGLQGRFAAQDWLW